MQMRQTLEVGCQPRLKVCQENIPSCPLSFLQGVEFSFGGENTKWVNGNDFSTRDQGIVGSLRT